MKVIRPAAEGHCEDLVETEAGDGVMTFQVRKVDAVWWEFDVRFDGCVHIRRYFNTPKGEPRHRDDTPDYLHICDLATTIEWLTAMGKRAQEHFGDFPFRFPSPSGGEDPK